MRSTLQRRRHTRLITMLGLGVAVLAAGCGGSEGRSADPAPAAERQSATPKPKLPVGRIAFRRYLDEAQTQGAIFTMRTDGTGEKQLTHPDEGWIDNHPDWSPDGRQIAYETCAESKPCSVWTVSADGGEPRKIRFRCRLKGDCDVAAPTWTPDGRLVVTLAQGRVRSVADRSHCQIQRSNLELIDLRTGKPRTIRSLRRWRRRRCGGLAGRPQGYLYRRNSARSKPAFGKAMFAVDINGSNDHQMASWGLGGGDIPCSRPAALILFRSFEGDDSRQSDYWTVRPDGSDLKQLTHFGLGTLVLSASYSPDGAWIVRRPATASAERGPARDARGRHRQQPLASTKWWDSAPDWAPARG